MSTMAEDHARDYARISANRDLNAAIDAFLSAREECLPKSPVCEHLNVVSDRLAEESARLVRTWN